MEISENGTSYIINGMAYEKCRHFQCLTQYDETTVTFIDNYSKFYRSKNHTHTGE